MVRHADEPTKHSCPKCGDVHDGRIYEPSDDDASSANTADGES